MWTIQLLGGLAARSPQRTTNRFRTRKTAALLAYLAFQCREGAPPCPREVLVEMVWSETDPGAGRHNLSNALSALRHVFEPPGVQPGAVLLADRSSVRLNPAMVTTDVARFEALTRDCLDRRKPEGERAALLHAAAAEYGGRLLPGFYEEWITPEAERLAGLFLRLTRDAAPLLRAQGELNLLLLCAQRAAADDPWSEEAVQLLMEALVATGDPSRAVRHYRVFERRLRDELDAEPSPGLRQYAAELRRVRRKAAASTEAEPALPVAETRSLTPPELGVDEERALRGTAFAVLTVTRFFDREEETRLLEELLCAPRSRLVTLTGPGGTGKTRLALETARRLVQAEQCRSSRKEGRPTSVTFVPLAELAEGDRVPEVLLRSLGLVPQPGRDPLEQAADALDREAAPLLVLDNFEHLVETGAGHVSSLLGRVPRARCLVTSRQKLLIEGERELPLAPLPTVARDETLEALAANCSIQLFIDRAQMSRPDFQLTPRNTGVVAELCGHLEGLPLALELAAARVALLTPAQILEGIRRDRLDFLVSRRRDAVARQRTLRATLDWSYELLPPEARRFLARLSVFRAGWTLGAAVVVTDAGDEEACLELLALLRDASLIHVQDRDDGMRFMLLETVRQYAEERLAAAGEKEPIRRRHGEYFIELAGRERRHFRTFRQAEALARLGRERENLRAAMEWSIETGEHGFRAQMANSLSWFWQHQGDAQQALTWYADVIKATDRCPLDDQVPRSLLIPMLLAVANIVGNVGRTEESERLCRWLLALTENREDPALRAEALAKWAIRAAHGSFKQRLAILEEALHLARQSGQTLLTARVLKYQATLLRSTGEFEAADLAGAEALELFRVLSDPMGIGDELLSRGWALLDQEGDIGAARSDLDENLAIRRQIGDEPGVAIALMAMGRLARREGDLPQAERHGREALAILEGCGWGSSINTAMLIQLLAQLAGEQQRAEEAWSLGGRALRIMLLEHSWETAGTVLEDMADWAMERGEWVRAARLTGATERLIPAGEPSFDGQERPLPRLLRPLEEHLGKEACAREREVGRGLSDSEVLELLEFFAV